ncbi:MAG: hypothetical protein KatS3mg105_4612 [Gemmatales bacterium]|nr:MAG: hypothetical protein KatS3mg105_4612 [Gemmatales bacterium]
MSSEPNKLVYFFGNGQAEAGNDLRHLVGGKGASLAELSRAGFPVPPGFTITTACCDCHLQNKQWPQGLEQAVRDNLARLEELTQKRFGDGADPLLLAVRSGAEISMPGMMDTLLNVGLNPKCVRAMAEACANPRTVWQAYRRFIVAFGETVAGIDDREFTAIISRSLAEKGKASETELDAAEMERLCHRLRDAFSRHNTRLPVDPWEMLCSAINAVFHSWNNDRAVAYRRHHNIPDSPGTAVTVQAMCPADVAGVLFTINPVQPQEPRMVIESSFGLGEAIVLGKVTPDRFVVDKESFAIIEKTIARKDQAAGSPVDAANEAERPSLDDEDVRALTELGKRVEAHFGHPCDIEWAKSAGRFYLLQARPIKPTADAAEEIERIRQEEIAALRERAEPGGTVWSRYNLAEVLPEPTPMTWHIVRWFMSVHGGYGQMYRDLGFDPDPSLGEEGILDLICGRPYVNLSREPRMQYRRLPWEHSFAALKQAPHKALYPQPTFNPARATIGFWFWLPWLTIKMVWAAVKLRGLARHFAASFRDEIIPAFCAEVAQAEKEELHSLSDEQLLSRFEYWKKRTLFDFARDSLKPTALAGLALAKIERLLARSLPPDRVRSAVGELTMGIRLDEDVDFASAWEALSAGRIDTCTFLERFGHRGPNEMELAQPRWSETGIAVAELTAFANSEKPTDCDVDKIAREANLSGSLSTIFSNEVTRLRTFLALRETGKHYLLKGYALIRRILVELDRRFHLDGGIFFLTPMELPALLRGQDFSETIARRRRRRELALRIEVPPVLFSDDLDAIGRAFEPQDAQIYQGLPLSAGVAEGEALVVSTPIAVEKSGYILVCPSTDPAWAPLFSRAKGLVLETGGMLSHGAIVAREYGLPAVAGIADVHRRIRTGQRLRVDGSKGTVAVIASQE